MEKNMNNYYMIKSSEGRKKYRKIIFLILILIVFAISTYFGVECAKKDIDVQKNVTGQQKEETSDDIPTIPKEDIENASTPNATIPPIEKKKNKIPITTEVGRENMKKVYSSTPDAKRVFLTFDDGPSSNVTPLILDVLKQNDIKATFFTLGSRVVQNPQIVKRAYEEGHYIGNHGYSHVYSNIYASAESLLAEYNQAEETIRNAIEVPEYSSHLFRFPGGSIGGKYNSVKKEYKKMLDEQGIFYVDWNCLNEDATGNRTKEQLVQFIKDTSVNKNSVVVLMHDAGDKILTYETLQEVIDYFRENGYTFYNFYDLIEYELK